MELEHRMDLLGHKFDVMYSCRVIVVVVELAFDWYLIT